MVKSLLQEASLQCQSSPEKKKVLMEKKGHDLTLKKA